MNLPKALEDVYNNHDKHFRQVRAYCVLKDGQHVAKVSIRYPQDGVGRVYAYVHFLGIRMVRGDAGGYGYDKTSAAVWKACEEYRKHKVAITAEQFEGLPDSLKDERRAFFSGPVTAFFDAITARGDDWKRGLEQAGYSVFQAV